MKTIPLTQGQFALVVDDEEFNRVNQYKWRTAPYRGGFRPMRTIKVEDKWKIVFMYRFILNAKIGELVDHADHNLLNNQKSNIRIATHRQSITGRVLSRHKKYLTMENV